jgi:hypothetical protein
MPSKQLLTHLRNNAVAYVALFVALSGTAVAASSAVPRNSVGTAQLKARSVTGSKVALRTLTGANVAKSSLTGANVAKSSLTGANVAKASLTGINIRSSTLGTVPNAAHLAGLTSAAFQHVITGSCRRGQAMETVSRQGKISCGSTGSITGVIAATGLTGGGTSGTVGLAVDPTVVQARVTSSCGPGHAIFSIRQDGSAACHTTNVTQMMGGTGAATLSPTSDFLVPVGVSAPTTQRQAAEVGSSDESSTARHLVVTVATAPASGASWTFHFYINGRERTGLKCVISGPANSCHTTGAVSIPSGARVALQETGSNITVGTTATFGWTDTTY